MPLGNTNTTIIPAGGSTGDVLTKISDATNAYDWAAPGGGGSGNTVLHGTVDPTTEGNDGDFYINTDTWQIFGAKTSGSWGSGTDLIGAPGSPGSPGSPGADGADGTDGTDGAAWHSDTIDPTTQGVDNDWFINTTSCDVFKKLTGTWTLQVNIKGGKGDKGDKGDDGDPGSPGSPGADGDDGTDGRSYIWHGAYDNGHGYVVDDTVSYNGSSYVCILTSTGNLPTDTTYWNLMASKGDTGGGGSLDIHGLSAETTVDDADETPFYDDSASANKKITFANLWLWIKGKITSVFLPVGTVKIFDNETSDPNSLWGGTWSRVDGGMPGMYKSGDTNFGTAMGTGGSLNHVHGVILQGGKTLAAGTAVAQIAGTGNPTTPAYPPYVTLCFWRRTA